MNKPTITFIGGGNMARSLLGGLITDGYDPQSLWVTNPSVEKLAQLKQRLNVQVTPDNIIGAKHADILVLAVKPQIMETVVKQLAEVVLEREMLIISVVAGTREEQIRHWLAHGQPMIVRCMPNTPALVGSGATALYANQFVTEVQKDLAESILRAVGITVWVSDEDQLDAVTALSGCGPAYFFLVMEALQESAEALGLEPDVARLLTLQTALGAARMAMESEQSTATLRKQVTSAGGATERALRVLEEGKLRELFKRALQAARQRVTELTTLFFTERKNK